MGGGIPATYVPARNTLFVAHALAVAEILGAERIALGINVLDSSGYPDCRPEWLRACKRPRVWAPALASRDEGWNWWRRL